MEKRLFLAIGLSLAVVFLYQSFFSPKPSPAQISSQDVYSEQLTKTESATKSFSTGAEVAALAPSTFDEELFSVESGSFFAKFTNKGGSIAELNLVKYDYRLPLTNVLDAFSLNGAKFSFNDFGNSIVLSAVADGWSVEKTFVLANDNTINAHIKIKNDSDVSRAFVNNGNIFVIDNSRMDNKELESDWTLFEYGFKSDKKIKRKNSAHNFDEKWNKEENIPVSWFAYRNRYFAISVMPNKPAAGYAVNTINKKELAVALIFPTENIGAGEEREFNFKIYAGPQDLNIMKIADPEFTKVMVFSDWGWLDAISKAIHWAAEFLHKLVPSWGLSIILMSIIIYTLMYPLTLQSLVSMNKMQALQPQMAELKKKYAKTPEKMNQEVMDLYKRNNVNPMSGCLPMLLQMPIFIGLYQVLWRSIFLRGESFLWIQDLSMPDRLFKLPFEIPFLGQYFNILPIIYAGVMFLQQSFNMKNHSAADPEQQMQQKMMLYMMPALMGFVFYNFSSGMNLYFVVFYALSAFTQWKISKNFKMAA